MSQNSSPTGELCRNGNIGCELGERVHNPTECFIYRDGSLLTGAGPDTPIETNSNGGSQSAIPYRFDLIDAQALAAMAKVLKEGADKYGENNWRQIPVGDHLNHLLLHVFAYLAGDTQDDHLSHALCRATFALGVKLEQEGQVQRETSIIQAAVS